MNILINRSTDRDSFGKSIFSGFPMISSHFYCVKDWFSLYLSLSQLQYRLLGRPWSRKKWTACRFCYWPFLDREDTDIMGYGVPNSVANYETQLKKTKIQGVGILDWKIPKQPLIFTHAAVCCCTSFKQFWFQHVLEQSNLQTCSSRVAKNPLPNPAILVHMKV